MKKNILPLVFFFSATMLSAESHVNAFVEGGSWFVIHNNFYYAEETYTIHGDTTICDHTCLKMWSSQNGEPERLFTHLYTEDDKVYFVKSDKFHLLYDFGLSVGDTTRVDLLNGSWYENNTERYIACEGFSELDNNGRQLKVMQVAEYAYGDDKYYQDGELLSKDEWIVGIGSVYEPFFNMCYDGISGVRPKVMKVTVGDEVLYDLCNDAEAANQINAFKQGSVWTEYSKLPYDPDTIVYTYSIDGELNIKGRSCMKLWETVAVPGREASTNLFTYLFTEGDKVFFVPVSNPDTCCLLYDFGLEVGDTVHVVNLRLLQSHPNYYDGRGWVNVETTQITNSGHTYTQYKIASEEDPSGDYGYWIKGIGNIDSMVANISNIGALEAFAREIVVSVDGEIVYRKYSSTPTPTSIEDLKTSDDSACYSLNGMRIRNAHNGLSIRNGKVEFRR